LWHRHSCLCLPSSDSTLKNIVDRRRPRLRKKGKRLDFVAQTLLSVPASSDSTQAQAGVPVPQNSTPVLAHTLQDDGLLHLVMVDTPKN